jgi:hypothetical protein
MIFAGRIETTCLIQTLGSLETAGFGTPFATFAQDYSTSDSL